MKRFPFLDWMRGLAILLMIQCHTFNSYARPDTRAGGPYVLTQFFGGMAAPLFLFMAGMTLAFQMEGAARRESDRLARWRSALRRGGYVLAVAFLFRLANCAAGFPHPYWPDLTRVDILNCMGAAMLVMSAAAVLDTGGRIRFALLAGLAVAAASPIVANLSWGSTPALVREYLAPGRENFPLFPNAAYVAFGMAAGAIVKATAAERFDRLMQWAVLVGFALVFTGQYFSNLPYSVYPKSDFWTDSPLLVVIRAGIALLLMGGCYLWTEYCVGPGWSWMQTLGKNSLMVYFVHVMLVYGDPSARLKGRLGIALTTLATVVVTGMMVGLSAAWMWWKAARARRGSPVYHAAGPFLPRPRRNSLSHR